MEFSKNVKLFLCGLIMIACELYSNLKNGIGFFGLPFGVFALLVALKVVKPRFEAFCFIIGLTEYVKNFVYLHLGLGFYPFYFTILTTLGGLGASMLLSPIRIPLPKEEGEMNGNDWIEYYTMDSTVLNKVMWVMGLVAGFILVFRTVPELFLGS